jgi:hypothetical protein
MGIPAIPPSAPAKVMTGASGVSNGAKGLVPQPLTGENAKFLRGDGVWESPFGTGVALTYGRVNASADLPSTAFSITSPGTKVPFNATVYSSGVTFTGTDTITPSQNGRYRVSWLMMAGSGEFNGDGTFHVTQNGVSKGSVFIDIMQAAGVNQVSAFLDLNLVAGQAVELRYQPAVVDSVPWGKGSYFDVTEIPTSIYPVVGTVDQAATGYFDIGTMRLQWGTFTQGSLAQTVTLPAAFANTNYVVTANSQSTLSSTTVRGTSFTSKTTVDFITLTNSTDAATVNAAAGNTIGYIAIGVKP